MTATPASALAFNEDCGIHTHLMSASARSTNPVAPELRDSITTEYLKRILTARVYDVAIETPLELAPNLSQRMNNQGSDYGRILVGIRVPNSDASLSKPSWRRSPIPTSRTAKIRYIGCFCAEANELEGGRYTSSTNSAVATEVSPTAR
jgi:hypothetical protein